MFSNFPSAGSTANLNRLLYTLVMLVAIILSWTIVRRQQRPLKLTESERGWLAFAAFVGAMLGAKTPFLMEQGWDGLAMGTVWFTDGKTILGGIFGGYLAIEIAKACLGIKVSTGDSFALPVAVAIALGRIACFFGGCCYGKVTTVAWGVHFPTTGDESGVLRHPTQLYEAAFHALAAIWLLVAQRQKWLRGHQLKAYLISYLIYRFVSEAIRPEPAVALGLSSYQLMSILLCGVLGALWYPATADELR